MPDENAGGDGPDDDELVVPGWDDAADSDQPHEDEGEAVASADPADAAEAGLEDGPEPDAEPVAPPRRRRSRKHAGEDRAAA